MKKVYKLFMLFLILFIGHSSYVKGDTTIASGTIDGTSIKWSVTSPNGSLENLKLSITGSGAIPSYSSVLPPWEDYNPKTTKIYFAPTITEIGNYAFYQMAITSLDIPASCTRIGESAFLRCANLKEVYIPSSVVKIGALAFQGCSSLSFIHYDGRCTSNTAISIGSGSAANGRIIEKEGTGSSFAIIPEGWEYYTHAEKCQGGAWVAENADQTKLFFYSNSSGAKVDYASTVFLSEDDQDATNHPWRLNCYKYKSLEIDKNIAAIGEDELRGYVNRDVTKMGYTNMQKITVQSGNSYFVVGGDGALYNKSKTIVYLYPSKSTATNIEIPATVTTIRSGAFYGAKNLKEIDFLGTISKIGTYAFAEASSLSFLGFVSGIAPTTTATTAFTGVAKTGVVAASVETNAFKTFTSKVGSGWTFAGETYGPVKSYVSNGTLYVVGKGEYTTSSYSASWYSQRSSIKNIVVKGGITNIGSSAFADCSNVTEVTLNNTGYIDYCAFKDCSALTRVNIGDKVKGFKSYYSNGGFLEVEKGYHYPFEGCSNLSQINIVDFASYNNIGSLEYLTDSEYGTCKEKILLINGRAISYTGELVIPEGVKIIDKSAIKFFENITKIKIPESVSEIRDHTFAGSYLKEITIPSTVGEVGYCAFEGCKSLQTATLNNSGDIDLSTFSGCTALQTVTLNNNGNIGSYVFQGCTSLKTAILNNNGNIGEGAFEGCTVLQTVTLNNGGKIGYHAFKDCVALTRVNIGANVKGFEYHYSDGGFLDVEKGYHYPFEGCSKLSTVNVLDLSSYCKISNLQYLTDSEYGTTEKKTLMVNGTTLASTSVLEIPNGVVSIPRYAFNYFTNVTKIKIPKSVSEIRDYAFAGSYLKEITVPSTVGKVGYCAFKGCTSLQTAILSNSGDIDFSAFNDCTALQTVTLNNNGNIGSWAFLGCTSLKTASLNNNGNIGTSMFEGCTALQTVTLNNSGTIGYHAFKDCVALTRVNIGAKVKGFEYHYSDGGFLDVEKGYHYPFEGCSKLVTVNITDIKSYCSITGIEYLIDSEYGTPASKTLRVNGVFFDSTMELDIPEGVTSIKKSAFRGFTNLARVKIPSTVTSVEKAAFCDCSSLKRIVCLAQKCPTAYSDIATNPENITLRVPGGMAALYKAATNWKNFKIEECKYEVQELNMYANEGRNLYTDAKVLSWTSSDTDVATVDKLNDVSGRLITKNYVYDGTTSTPYKTVTIKADLGDYDTYIWKIRVEPNECVLTDGNAYKLAKDFDAEKISYTRNYKTNVVGKWQAFYVPFDIEVTDELLEDYDFAKLYMVSYYDANDNGEIEDDEPLRMTFNKFSAGKTLYANMPYFVRVKSAGTKTIELTNAVLKAAEKGSVNCSTTEHEYTLVGIYEPTLMQGRYGMSSSGGFTYITNPTTKLGANRWYMEVKSRTGKGAKLENYARPIEIYVEGEDEETTGITTVEDKASASQKDKVFTLDGRQVTDTDNLPSGIYIINGKKVFKK